MSTHHIGRDPNLDPPLDWGSAGTRWGQGGGGGLGPPGDPPQYRQGPLWSRQSHPALPPSALGPLGCGGIGVAAVGRAPLGPPSTSRDLPGVPWDQQRPPPGWAAPLCPPPSALGPPGHGGIRALDRPPRTCKPPQYLQGLPQLLPASQFPPPAFEYWALGGSRCGGGSPKCPRGRGTQCPPPD